MEDFGIQEMQEMQKALQDTYRDQWEPICPDTVKRVEVAAPVYQENLKERLQELFDILLHDNQKARWEDKEGGYHMRVNEEKPVNAQEALYQMAYDRITEKI